MRTPVRCEFIENFRRMCVRHSLPYYYSVLIDKISFSVLLWFSVTKKIVAYDSEIRFDPSIPDLEDLAIPHAIVSENKLFKI
jgi:hypothetical protein